MNIENPRLEHRAIVSVIGLFVMAGAVALLETGNQSWMTIPAAAPITYHPPTMWAGLPAGLRQKYLAWDQVIWNLEQSGQQSAAANLIGALMSQAGSDAVKGDLACLVFDTGRFYLIEPLVGGLDPNITGPTARMTILTVLQQICDTGGLVAFKETAIESLVAYRESGVEQHPATLATLRQLVNSLGS